MTALMDTGFLLAVLDADDDMYEVCVLGLEAERVPILPEVVIPELAYLVLCELGYPVLIQFLQSVVNGELALEKAAIQDPACTAEILEKYADRQVDFVDCAIVVMAERLNIKRIMTVDRRHFQLCRPKHCPAFEIVP